MRVKGQKARKAGIACGTVVGSVLLAFSTATSGGAASTALVVGGIGASSLGDIVMSRLLGGALQDQERVNVYWPAEAGPYTGRGDLPLGESIRIGMDNLNTEIDAALARLERDEDGNVLEGEQVTVVGLSAGSLVVTEVLREMSTNPYAPDADEIEFIVVADSSRQELIRDARYNSRYDYTYQPAPETEYNTKVVTGEYDGLADFPDRWWNLVAVANAMAGSIFVHVPMMFADLDEVPAENITTRVNELGGTVTEYLVPTERLPLVQLMPFLASSEASLKAMVDRGYSRNDVPRTNAALTAEITAASATSALSATAETSESTAATVTSESSARSAADESESSATGLRRAQLRATALAEASPRSDETAATTVSSEASSATAASASREAEATSEKSEARSATAEAAPKKAEATSEKSETKSAAADDAKSEAKAAKDSKASSASDSASKSESKSDSKSAAKSSSKSSDSKKNTSKKRDSKAGSR